MAVADGAQHYTFLRVEPNDNPQSWKGEGRMPPVAAERGGCKVVIASWEDEPSELNRRVRGIQERLKWPQYQGLNKNLRAYRMAGEGPIWHMENLAKVQQGALSPAGRRLLNRCRDEEARLLILDPLAAAYGGNENDRVQVRAFMSYLDRWAQDAECTVLLIAHPSKTSNKSTNSTGSDDDYANSGSTDWHSAARSVWELKQADTKQKDSTDKAVKAPLLACTKSSYGSSPPPVWLRSEFIEGKAGVVWIEASSAKDAAQRVCAIEGKQLTITERSETEGQNKTTTKGWNDDKFARAGL